MADLVYPPVIAFAKTMFRALNMKITILGEEHVPASGGAVIACNHISYLDFIFCGLGARQSRRLVRFMAKESIFRNRIGGPLMRGMHHIPVDRDAGMASYKAALAALKAGEVVGVFPEATIDRSFTIKDFKSGAVRLAAATGTPLVPMVLWGTQRFWTKGRPRDLTQRGVAITIRMGEPLHPTRKDNGDTVSAELRSRMKTMLVEVQRGYPQKPAGPDDLWWLPAHLGGTAPEPEVLEAEAQ
ncbi:lysophospholipid acyltransferase family protein [Dactylosporangium matsuzakiense]|uniref:lysophospholipid acyltransferase family protein n=1 Tax=Dactylosporangium matsuzakiense TaxID=53360 RepID=UPI0021C475DE|nr:lysophospholipid acyltransferase family protein [Dactylosporangium matsuzakiense]UWZ48966.1 1-acyl-sn-glycerol-3-phosphate acyltransferase [Dactylosporangium matsuzakiense]